VRVARTTDSSHHAGSLLLAQIGAQGEFLEGSRRGQGRRAAQAGCSAGERAQVQESGRGEAGQRSRGDARRKEKRLTSGPGVSEEREGRRGCWLGPGEALGRGEREGAKREVWRTRAFEPGKGEVARPCVGG
jgi:hypothetical protein